MRTRRDHPNYCITKIGQNVEKSPGDFEGTCCHSNPSEKSFVYAGLKKCPLGTVIKVLLNGPHDLDVNSRVEAIQ